MTIFEKYKLYTRLKNNTNPITLNKHYSFQCFETAVDKNTNVLTEKRFPDFYDEGEARYTLIIKNSQKNYESNGFFAKIIYSLLRNKYFKNNGKNR